jgi:acetylornithine/N-succinyldiaminopimelate aminotransferase
MTVAVHGTTFGGNPLAMAVATAAFDTIAKDDMLAHVRTISAKLFTGLREIAERYADLVVDVRGKGLLIGVKLVPNNRAMMATMREHGLLVAGGGENCIRLLPPLTITDEEVAEVLARFEAALAATRAAG